MEHLDRMEYDPVNPAPYNIKVLQEKRKKVKETWDRVYRLYVSDEINQNILIEINFFFSRQKINQKQQHKWIHY